MSRGTASPTPAAGSQVNFGIDNPDQSNVFTSTGSGEAGRARNVRISAKSGRSGHLVRLGDRLTWIPLIPGQPQAIYGLLRDEV